MATTRTASEPPRGVSSAGNWHYPSTVVGPHQIEPQPGWYRLGSNWYYPPTLARGKPATREPRSKRLVAPTRAAHHRLARG